MARFSLLLPVVAVAIAIAGSQAAPVMKLECVQVASRSAGSSKADSGNFALVDLSDLNIGSSNEIANGNFQAGSNNEGNTNK